MNEKDKSKSGSLKIGTSAIGCIVALFGLLCAVSFSSAQTDPAPVATVSVADLDAPVPASDSVAVESAVPAPAEGRTIMLTAADLVAGGEREVGSRASLFSKSNVEVPAEADGKTVADAVEEIARSAGRRLEYLATNVVDVLQEPYVAPVKTSTAAYADLLKPLLPAGYSAWSHDDGVYLFVGADGDINRKRTEYEVERLANNHTRIAFSASDMTLYDAVLRIKSLSKANIITSYMEKDDQHSDAAVASQNAGTLSAESIGGGTNAFSNCRRVSYSTDGAEMEWRTVLSSVLEPDYTFDEVDGKVRVATRARFKKMNEEEINSRPMELRYVRVYHANPEDIVARLEPLKITQNVRASIQVAPYQEKAKKDNVNSYRHNLSSSSSRLTLGGTTLGDSSSSSSGSWGNLLRPKNPPAILVYDNVDNLDRIEEAIRALDVRDKQVLIEALILSLSDNGARELGMKLSEMGFDHLPLLGVSYTKTHDKNRTSSNSDTWNRTDDRVSNARRTIIRADGTDDRGTPDSLNNGKANYWSSNASVSLADTFAGEYDTNRTSKRSKAFSSVIGPLDFKFILSMVEENGYGKSLSSPVVTIGDHSEAMIHVGNVRPIVQTETTYSGDNSYPVQSYEWQELLLGLHMWVGPEVTRSGDAVRLWVHPKITSDANDDVYAPDGSSYPRLRSEELDTRVTVLSGSTLLIGGLTENDESEILKKVPILGDIPLLGRLFRWNSRSSGRNNLVILIRPTVLDDDEPDTGFEAPANAIIDPMMSSSGRNLKDVAFTEDSDPMKRREKAIRETVREKFFGRKENAAEIAEEAEDAEPADEVPEVAVVAEPEAEPATVTVTVFEADE